MEASVQLEDSSKVKVTQSRQTARRTERLMVVILTRGIRRKKLNRKISERFFSFYILLPCLCVHESWPSVIGTPDMECVTVWIQN